MGDALLQAIGGWTTAILHKSALADLAGTSFAMRGWKEVPMRATALARSADLARKALLVRKEKIAAVAEVLRRSEQEEPARKPDQLDRAAEVQSHEILAALQAAEARELAEIDAALNRVAKGHYGWCERCGGAVGQLRLRAVPETRLCMACAVRR
jgi:RNA polymerase-binding protein DksA